MTSADEAERDRWLESVLRQTPRNFRKAELRVMGADEAETVDTLRYLELVVCEQAQLLRKLAPLRFFNWPLQFLSASSISEILSSAEVACDKCGQIWKKDWLWFLSKPNF